MKLIVRNAIIENVNISKKENVRRGLCIQIHTKYAGPKIVVNLTERILLNLFEILKDYKSLDEMKDIPIRIAFLKETSEELPVAIGNFIFNEWVDFETGEICATHKLNANYESTMLIMEDY